MNVLLDHPLILSVLFHPRRALANSSREPNVHDGTLASSTPGIALGYRLYRHSNPAAPLLIFWHGNGETAADYDGLAPTFRGNGMALLMIDYRGYGWSTGEPRGSTLLADTEAAMQALPAVLAQHGVSPEAPLYSYGRSLGSAPAIHQVALFPDRFSGLILDSALAHAPTVLQKLGLPWLSFENVPDPFGNEAKIQHIPHPTLIIHGEQDRLIPFDNALRLFDLSPAAYKRLLRVPPAGHNNLFVYAMVSYFRAINDLVRLGDPAYPDAV